MRRSNENGRALLEELRRHGIAGRLTRRRRHPAVIFEHCGRTHVHIYAGTPGDCRALRNSLAGLRRTLRTCVCCRD